MFAQSFEESLDLKTEYNVSTERYEVYARADVDYNGADLNVSQISLVFPEDVLSSDLTIMSSAPTNSSWMMNNVVNSPMADSVHNFISFLNFGGTIAVPVNTWLLLFEVEHPDGCLSNTRLYDREIDPGPVAPGMNNTPFDIFLTFTINGMFTEVFRSVVTGTTQIVFVDQSATGTGTGNSWSNAYTELSDALTNTNCWTEEIWVAEGTYLPTTGTNRTAAFRLTNGIQIYGGFIGGEDDRRARLGQANLTILSGNIGNNAIFGDNSFNVVEVRNAGAERIVIDGFRVTQGNANAGSPNRRKRGGGIYVARSNVDVKNCNVINNYCEDNGGGIYAFRSEISIENCTSNNNTAGLNGGGIFINRCDADLRDITANGNLAVNIGGGIFFGRTNMNVLNLTLSQNDADQGGGLYATRSSGDIVQALMTENAASNAGNAIQINNCNPLRLINSTIADNFGAGLATVQVSNNTTRLSILNSILWNEGSEISAPTATVNAAFSNIQGGFAGANVFDTDPLFNAFGDYRLSDLSPLIDVAADFYLPAEVMTDLGGEERFVVLLDIGAYENQTGGGQIRKSKSEIEMVYSVFPNPTTDYVNMKFETSSIDRNFYILDQIGRMVIQGEASSVSQELNVQQLAKGNYFIVVEEGDVIHSNILVKI